jgi:uncharacterized protein YcgL (UPF0745 family)
MEELGRFIRNLLSSIVYQFKYRLTEAADRKVRETIDQQMYQLQKPKKHEQAQDDRK